MGFLFNVKKFLLATLLTIIIPLSNLKGAYSVNKWYMAGVVGIVTVASVAGVLYYSDFKNLWDDYKEKNPDGKYLVVHDITSGKKYILTENLEVDSGFSRWFIGEHVISVYGNGKNIDAEVFPVLEYYKTFGEDEWIRLDRQATKVNVDIIIEGSSVKVVRSTPYYGTASRSSRGGVLYETFVLPYDTDSSMKWDVNFTCEGARCNSDNRLTYEFREIKQEFVRNWLSKTIMYENFNIDFRNDADKIENMSIQDKKIIMTFKPQTGNINLDPIVRMQKSPKVKIKNGVANEVCFRGECLMNISGEPRFKQDSKTKEWQYFTDVVKMKREKDFKLNFSDGDVWRALDDVIVNYRGNNVSLSNISLIKKDHPNFNATMETFDIDSNWKIGPNLTEIPDGLDYLVFKWNPDSTMEQWGYNDLLSLRMSVEEQNSGNDWIVKNFKRNVSLSNGTYTVVNSFFDPTHNRSTSADASFCIDACGGDLGTNFGTDAALRMSSKADNQGNTWMFGIRFNTTGLPAGLNPATEIIWVKLNFVVRDAGPITVGYLNRTNTENDWTETGITGNNNGCGTDVDLLGQDPQCLMINNSITMNKGVDEAFVLDDSINLTTILRQVYETSNQFSLWVIQVRDGGTAEEAQFHSRDAAVSSDKKPIMTVFYQQNSAPFFNPPQQLRNDATTTNTTLDYIAGTSAHWSWQNPGFRHSATAAGAENDYFVLNGTNVSSNNKFVIIANYSSGAFLNAGGYDVIWGATALKDSNNAIIGGARENSQFYGIWEIRSGAVHTICNQSMAFDLQDNWAQFELNHSVIGYQLFITNATNTRTSLCSGSGQLAGNLSVGIAHFTQSTGGADTVVSNWNKVVLVADTKTIPLNYSYVRYFTNTFKINVSDVDGTTGLNVYFTHNKSGSNTTVSVTNSVAINSSMKEFNITLDDLIGGVNYVWALSCEDSSLATCTNTSGIFRVNKALQTLTHTPANQSITWGSTLDEACSTSTTDSGSGAKFYRNVSLPAGSSTGFRDVTPLSSFTYPGGAATTACHGIETQNFTSTPSNTTVTVTNMTLANLFKFIDNLPQNKTITFDTGVTLTANTTSTVTQGTLPNLRMLLNGTVRCTGGNSLSCLFEELSGGTYAFNSDTLGHQNISSLTNSTNMYLFVNRGTISLNTFIGQIPLNKSIGVGTSTTLAFNLTDIPTVPPYLRAYLNDTRLYLGQNVTDDRFLSNTTASGVFQNITLSGAGRSGKANWEWESSGRIVWNHTSGDIDDIVSSYVYQSENISVENMDFNATATITPISFWEQKNGYSGIIYVKNVDNYVMATITSQDVAGLNASLVKVVNNVQTTVCTIFIDPSSDDSSNANHKIGLVKASQYDYTVILNNTVALNNTISRCSGRIDDSVFNGTAQIGFVSRSVSSGGDKHAVAFDDININKVTSFTNHSITSRPSIGSHNLRYNSSATINHTAASNTSLWLFVKNITISTQFPSQTTNYTLNISTCVGPGCFQNGTYTPENQTVLTETSGTPTGWIINVTNVGEVPVNVSVKMTSAPPACIQLYLVNASTQIRNMSPAQHFNITATEQRIITNLAVGNNATFWSWTFLNSCEPGTNYDALFNFTSSIV